MTTEKKTKNIINTFATSECALAKEEEEKRKDIVDWIQKVCMTTQQRKEKDIVIRRTNKYRGLDEIKHKERNNK